MLPSIVCRALSSREGSSKLTFPSWIVSWFNSCDSCLPKIMDWCLLFIALYSSPGSLSEISVLVIFSVSFWQRLEILFSIIIYKKNKFGKAKQYLIYFFTSQIPANEHHITAWSLKVSYTNTAFVRNFSKLLKGSHFVERHTYSIHSRFKNDFIPRFLDRSW